MKIHGVSHRAIESEAATRSVRILDQTLLPHRVEWRALEMMHDAAEAIRVMRVRGAPLIGATAAFGMFLAMRADHSEISLNEAYRTLYATRPTAVNLRWALDRMKRVLTSISPEGRAETAWNEARAICDEDVRTNRAIGEHALGLFREAFAKKCDHGATLNVMTHCNAGWIACVDWGTAISPIYQAHDAGMNVHVWVSETRPRGQGAALTAWELNEHGVPHTLVVDNSAGHLMQRGLVDLCIVGADRATARGDVANKIGTYLKALAAREHGVPFYVALPTSTIDWSIEDGIRDIPIEQRSPREVTHIPGLSPEGAREEVLITTNATAARNDAFDVTPAGLVTALITEHGVFRAAPDDIGRLGALSRKT